MKPIRRTTRSVKQLNHENRIQALERRIIPGPPEWAVASFAAGAQPVSSGGTLLAWDHFRTTTPALSTSEDLGDPDNNMAGDTAIRLSRSGIMLVSGWAVFEDGTFYRTVAIDAVGGELDPISNLPDGTNIAARGDSSVDSGGNPLSFSDDQWFANSDDSFAAWFALQANVDIADDGKTATSASLSVMLFPSSGMPWDDTRVY